MPLFEGSGTELQQFLAQLQGRSYVYELCRPGGAVFYVGKGLSRRALEHEAEAKRHHPLGESNPFKCNVIRKILREGGSVLYRIDSSYESDAEVSCLAREAALIASYKRLHEGGPLTNLAGGMGSSSGWSPHSLERHAATLSGQPENNPQRAILNTFLLSIGPVESVPVKPKSQIARILPTLPHPQARTPKPRNAYALVASASAHALPLTEGCVIPRSFRYAGVDAIIENGVSRDLVKAGLADLLVAAEPEDESYQLSHAQVQLVIALVGERRLAELGLV